MQITCYPKRLLITAFSFVALWAALSAAMQAQAAAGVAAIVSTAAAVTLDVFLSINPAAWGRTTHSTTRPRASR